MEETTIIPEKKKSNFWKYSPFILIIAAAILVLGIAFNTLYENQHAEIIVETNETKSINETAKINETKSINETAKNANIQIVLINPVGCIEEACNDFSVEAQEYADLLNITFNRVAYPQETSIPAIYIIAEGSMSLISGIESKDQIGEYVCLVTRSRAACEKAGLLENITQDVDFE